MNIETQDGFIWPEIFQTGELPEGWTKESLLADGLEGWGLAYVSKAPANFAKGMGLIGSKLGVSTADGLTALKKTMNGGVISSGWYKRNIPNDPQESHPLAWQKWDHEKLLLPESKMKLNPDGSFEVMGWMMKFFERRPE